MCKLVPLHRPQQAVVPAQQLGEARIAGKAAVEVGAQRRNENDAAVTVRSRPGEGREEQRSFLLVITGGEEFLELVDREHEPLTRAQLVKCRWQRLTAEHPRELRAGLPTRAHQPRSPALATRQRP